MNALDVALKKLMRKRTPLNDGNKRIGRRNARRRFLMQLAAVGRAVDESYPAMPKVPRVKSPCALEGCTAEAYGRKKYCTAAHEREAKRTRTRRIEV